MLGYERNKSFQFSFEIDSDVDGITADDRLFLARAATTRNAWSPVVERSAYTTAGVDRKQH